MLTDRPEDVLWAIQRKSADDVGAGGPGSRCHFLPPAISIIRRARREVRSARQGPTSRIYASASGRAADTLDTSTPLVKDYFVLPLLDRSHGARPIHGDMDAAPSDLAWFVGVVFESALARKESSDRRRSRAQLRDQRRARRARSHRAAKATVHPMWRSSTIHRDGVASSDSCAVRPTIDSATFATTAAPSTARPAAEPARWRIDHTSRANATSTTPRAWPAYVASVPTTPATASVNADGATIQAIPVDIVNATKVQTVARSHRDVESGRP